MYDIEFIGFVSSLQFQNKNIVFLHAPTVLLLLLLLFFLSLVRDEQKETMERAISLKNILLTRKFIQFKNGKTLRVLHTKQNHLELYIYLYMYSTWKLIAGIVVVFDMQNVSCIKV